MKREEAIKFWKFRYENAKDYTDPHWEAQERREHREYVEALRMAIEALSERTGEWLEVEVFPEVYDIEGVKTWGSEMQCDQCGFRHTAIEGHMAQYNFCPNCGARMLNGGRMTREEALKWFKDHTIIDETKDGQAHEWAIKALSEQTICPIENNTKESDLVYRPSADDTFCKSQLITCNRVKECNGVCPFEDALKHADKMQTMNEQHTVDHDRDWIIGCIEHDGFIKTDRFDKANQIILDALSAEAENESCGTCKYFEKSHREYPCSDCTGENSHYVSADRPHGEWYNRDSDGTWATVDFAYCSECKQPIIHKHASPLWHFCPNCGADMRGEQG